MANIKVKNANGEWESTAIANVRTFSEPVVLTGDCQYACAGKCSGLYLDGAGSNTTTKDITNAGHMFYRYGGESVPFEINMKNSSKQNFEYEFSYANIQTLPKINGAYPNDIYNTFTSLYYLKEIPEDYFDDWNWDYLHTSTSARMSNNFAYCYCLRNIPVSFLNNFWGLSSNSMYNPYYSSIQSLYVLDKVEGIGIQQGTLTSNCMSSFCANLYRASEITFMTNEDGTAKTAKWKSQTLDLSKSVGYASSYSYITDYTEYTGISKYTEVTDDATYQALKNHPDWWSKNVAYSRYNHDSAVRTINSLPDCSAYLATAGGTNTIKFKGASGSLTDGGAINTLTEAEIAVATEKGWTVTLA